MHAAVASFVAGAIERHDRDHGGPFERVLEVGSRDVNGGVRSLFGPCEYLGIDLVDGPGVDIVADAIKDALVDVPLDYFDCVVCTNVLEHEPAWPLIPVKAYRWLGVDGWFIATAPCDPFPEHSAVDGGALRDGEWYMNVSPGMLWNAVAHDFEIESAVMVPPDVAIVGIKR